MTLEEIGEKFNLTRERVRQIYGTVMGMSTNNKNKILGGKLGNFRSMKEKMRFFQELKELYRNKDMSRAKNKSAMMEEAKAMIAKRNK